MFGQRPSQAQEDDDKARARKAHGLRRVWPKRFVYVAHEIDPVILLGSLSLVEVPLVPSAWAGPWPALAIHSRRGQTGKLSYKYFPAHGGTAGWTS